MTKNNINFISNTYYKNHAILAHSNKGYRYYVTVGSRGRGKTYSGKNYILKKFVYRNMAHWNKAYRDGKMWKIVWGRLTQSAVDKVLADNASSFFEPSLLRKYGVRVDVINDYIYFAKENNYTMVDGEKKYEYYACIRVLAIQNYGLYKGNQFTDYDEIIMDELVRAKGERRTFNVATAFKNFIENIARQREDIRCLIYANAVNELEELQSLFGWMPFPGKFGMYFLQKKGQNFAIIEYLEDSEEWKKKTAVSMAGLLGSPDDTEFSNRHVNDTDWDLLRRRTALRSPSLMFRVLYEGILYNMMSYELGYYFDLESKRDFKHTTVPTYTLQKHKAGTNAVYSKEVGPLLLSLWTKGMIKFDSPKILREFKDMMKDGKQF